MLWTAPDGWGNLGGGIICSTIRKITCEKCSKSRIGEEVKKKTQPSDAVNSTWWLGVNLEGHGLIWGGDMICSICICSTILMVGVIWGGA